MGFVLTPVCAPSAAPVRTRAGWHVLGTLLVLFWLSVLGLELRQSGGVGAVTVLSAGSLKGALPEQEQWLGAYHRSGKLGYVHQRVLALADGFTLQQDSALAISAGGARRRIDSKLQVELGPDLLLRRFHLQLAADELALRVTGRMQNEGLALEVHLGREVSRSLLPLKEPPLFDLAVLGQLARRELRAGDRFQVTVFDPRAMQNQPAQIEVVGREVVRALEGLVPAVRLRREVAGERVDIWLDDRGAVVREESESGLILQREDRETAVSGLGSDGSEPEGDAARLLRLLLPDPARGERRQ